MERHLRRFFAKLRKMSRLSLVWSNIIMSTGLVEINKMPKKGRMGRMGRMGCSGKPSGSKGIGPEARLYTLAVGPRLYNPPRPLPDFAFVSHAGNSTIDSNFCQAPDQKRSRGNRKPHGWQINGAHPIFVEPSFRLNVVLAQ